MKNFQVAIDGPVGVGKSTVARLTAERAGFLYIDSGALYRAVALYVRRKLGKIPGNEDSIRGLLPEISLSLKTDSGEQKVFLNGEEVTEAIRSAEETRGSSAVAVFPAVREFVTKRARELAASGSVVMDGRDVGTAILPEADLKIFLTATIGIRAERRYKQLLEKGRSPSLDMLLHEIMLRDLNDSNRDASPLRADKEAVVIDCENMSIDEVVETILRLIAERGGLNAAV